MKNFALSVLMILVGNAALAFPTGSFECLNGPLADSSAKLVSKFQISKVSLKSDSGTVELPYMEYSYNDENGNRANIKGIAQVSSESWTNTIEKQVIQMDSHSIRVVFTGSKIQTISGECRKTN